MGQNGPLKQLLEAVMQGSDIHPALKGPMFELEEGLELESVGEKVIEFGKKIGGREFDIATKTKLIECKDIDWNHYNVQKSLTMNSNLRVSQEDLENI